MFKALRPIQSKRKGKPPAQKLLALSPSLLPLVVAILSRRHAAGQHCFAKARKGRLHQRAHKFRKDQQKYVTQKPLTWLCLRLLLAALVCEKFTMMGSVERQPGDAGS